jgi:CheY-like chemotaxis protein/two-component sensor histidine kinase
MSQIESGQVHLRKETVNLNILLEEILSLTAPEAKAVNLPLNLKKTLETKNAMVECDRQKLSQIITNLIKNAIKFTKQGEIEFGYDIIADSIQFYVSDTGIGIPKEMHDRIFERFIQVEMGYTRNYEGAGLGLSISKAFVEILDGSIWLESKEGKGTTFYFSIPYTPVAIEEEEESQESEITHVIEDMSPVKILIAEDEEISFAYFAKVMSNEHFEILHARNGEEAVDIVEKNPDIDIILMDIKMPRMDGYKARELIKKSHPNIPIIAQTAYAMQDDKHKILNAGFDDYISKPVKREDLLDHVSKYCCTKDF